MLQWHEISFGNSRTAIVESIGALKFQMIIREDT